MLGEQEKKGRKNDRYFARYGTRMKQEEWGKNGKAKVKEKIGINGNG